MAVPRAAEDTLHVIERGVAAAKLATSLVSLCRVFGEHLAAMTPVFKGIVELKGGVAASSMGRMEQIQLLVRQAVQLLASCRQSSKFHLVVRGPQLAKRMRDMSAEMQRCLGSLHMSSSASIDLIGLRKKALDVMQSAPIQLDSTEEFLAEEILAVIEAREQGRQVRHELLARVAAQLGIATRESLVNEALRLENSRRAANLDGDEKEASLISGILSLLQDINRSASTESPRSCKEYPAAERQGSSHLKEAVSPVPPEEFQCPISLQLMCDPVIIASGQTYERVCINKWFADGKNTCPKTRQVLAHFELTPNYCVKGLIASWCAALGVDPPEPPSLPALRLSKQSCAAENVEEAKWEKGQNRDGSLAQGGQGDVEGSGASVPGTPNAGTVGALSDPEAHELGLSLDSRNSSFSSELDTATSLTQGGLSSTAELGDDAPRSGSAPSSGQLEQSAPIYSVAGFDDLLKDAPRLTTLAKPAVDAALWKGGLLADYHRSMSTTRRGALILPSRSPSHWQQSKPSGLTIVSSRRASLKLPDSPRTSWEAMDAASSPSSNSPSSAVGSPSNASTLLTPPLLGAPPPLGAFGPRKPGSHIIDALCQQLMHGSLDVKKRAAKEIRTRARSDPQTRTQFGKLGAVIPLVALLQEEDTEAQQSAILALLNLSIGHPPNKAVIVSAGALRMTVEILSIGATQEIRETAAALLLSLAVLDENKVAIGKSGAVPLLVSMLSSGSTQGKTDAAQALFNLSIYVNNRSAVMEAGAVSSLVDILLDNPEPNLSEKVVQALVNLLATEEGRAELESIDGSMGALCDVLDSGSPRGREHAAAALLLLCSNSPSAMQSALQEGAVPSLMVLSQSGTPRGQEKASKLLLHFREHRVEDAVERADNPDAASEPSTAQPAVPVAAEVPSPKMELKAQPARGEAETSRFSSGLPPMGSLLGKTKSDRHPRASLAFLWGNRTKSTQL